MTTTAFDDQFTVATQTILRTNVSESQQIIHDLQVRVKQLLTDYDTLADEYQATCAAHMETLSKLDELREQKPVAWMHDKDGRVDTCHDSVKELWIKVGQKQNTQFMREIVPCRVEHYNIPLYSSPVPAPDMRDAYEGAREDLLDWKRRALEAEAELAKLREQKPVGWQYQVPGDDTWLPGDDVMIPRLRSAGAKFRNVYAAPVPAPAVPEQKPIWSGWSVWFKGGDGLFPAHFLHDNYGIPLRFPTRFDAAEKIKRHTKDSRELYEPRGYSLYDAPQAPAVPATCNEGLQVELRGMLQWMIGQRGKSGHNHKRPGIWDDDNGVMAGKTCEVCAMYDEARALLQSARGAQ